MLWKQFASATICACILLAFAPSRALAQTQPRDAAGERRVLTDPRAEARPPLKALFAERASEIKTSGLTEADFRRFEQQQQQQGTQQQAKQNYTKRQKVVFAIVIVAVAAVCIVAISHHAKDIQPDCANDPSNTLCS
jgi:phosphate-selective porin